MSRAAVAPVRVRVRRHRAGVGFLILVDGLPGTSPRRLGYSYNKRRALDEAADIVAAMRRATTVDETEVDR